MVCLGLSSKATRSELTANCKPQQRPRSICTEGGMSRSHCEADQPPVAGGNEGEGGGVVSSQQS